MAVLVVLGRFVTPEDFGIIALAAVFISAFALLTEQGLGKALVQRLDLRPEHSVAALWVSAALAVLFTLALVLSAPAISRILGEPTLGQVLPWLAAGLILGALSSVPSALLERRLQFRSLAIRRLAGTVAGGLAAVVVAVLGGGVWALVAQALIGSLMGLIVLWTLSDWRPRGLPKWQALKDLWLVGIGILGIEVVGLLGAQGDRFLIGAAVGAGTLGLYFMATRLVSIIVELFTSVFFAGSLAMFSRLQSDLPQMRARLYRLTAASSAVVIPCFALSGLLAPDLLPFVLGEKWDPVVPLYQVLTLLGAVNAVAIFDRSVLIAAGRGQVAFLLTVGQAILGIVLVLAALDYGIMAIGIAIVARQYLYWPVRLWVLKRAIGASPTTYLLQWLRPAMAATAMIPAFLAIEHFGSPTWPTLLRIVVASGCGVCTYLLCLRLLSRRAFQEIVSTMKSLWQGRL